MIQWIQIKFVIKYRESELAYSNLSYLELI